MTFEFIPQNLSIKAMRSSGYRDSAHALAELVDNALQAGEGLPGPTQVELICVDKAPVEGGRKRISRIGVFDNACGMEPLVLRKALQFGNGTNLDRKRQKGIGKFGMGLPNSSISQCRRVDVWSWRDGQVYWTFLDVGEIEKGQRHEVPEPVKTVFPNDWLKMIGNSVEKQGTLVVWSDLDRVSWKQSSTLLTNTAFIAGRVYRHFIDKKTVRIRLASYEEHTTGFTPNYEDFVKPNDPLYLMKDTNTPAPYDKEPAFVPFGTPQIVRVGYKGEEHLVQITASICKPVVRTEGGNRPIGQHTVKNQGISVVRAGRELELNRSFENSYDPRERWWGIQVEFGPELDEVFGVTNNKQSATNFMRRDLEEDARAENLPVPEYQNMLETDEDPRMPMYLVSSAIDGLLEGLRTAIRRMKSVQAALSKEQTPETIAERSGTTSIAARRQIWGNTGRSDIQESEPVEQRAEALAIKLEQDGLDKADAHQIAVEYVKKELKFRFRHTGLAASSAFFDINSLGGVVLVTLNTENPIHPRLFEPVQDSTRVDDPYLKEILLLMLAWARMEDEASPGMLRAMRDVRQLWGRIVVDMVENAPEIA